MAIFGFLGDIPLGDGVLTGPSKQGETFKASLPELKVARGKPAVHDTGDELDQQSLEFFFDETFCDPEAELAKLKAAYAARSPLAFIRGAGGYSGARYVIEEMQADTLRTTPSGRATRYHVNLRMKESPIQNPLAWLGAIARMGALALTPWGSSNPGARK